jgi:hypothetical protein
VDQLDGVPITEAYVAHLLTANNFPVEFDDNHSGIEGEMRQEIGHRRGAGDRSSLSVYHEPQLIHVW